MSESVFQGLGLVVCDASVQRRARAEAAAAGTRPCAAKAPRCKCKWDGAGSKTAPEARRRRKWDGAGSGTAPEVGWRASASASAASYSLKPSSRRLRPLSPMLSCAGGRAALGFRVEGSQSRDNRFQRGAARIRTPARGSIGARCAILLHARPTPRTGTPNRTPEPEP